MQLQKSLWNHSGQAGSELEPMWSPLGSMWSRFGHAWSQFGRVGSRFGRVGSQFGRVWNQFGNDERGQDMVEYTMLLAFVCLASAALFIGVGQSLSSIWSVANSRMSAAASAAVS